MNIKFLAIFIFLFSNAIAAQTKTQFVEPRTVTDFYLQLPANYVNNTNGEAARRRRILIEDAANGYLKLAPTGAQDKREYTEIALFKKSSGGYIAAVVNVECAENCLGSPTFLERRADRWKEFTPPGFPVSSEAAKLAVYKRKKTAVMQDYEPTQSFWTQTELPRTGRTIKVKYTGEGASKELPLFALTWNGERFASDETLPAETLVSKEPSAEKLRAAEAAWKPFFAAIKTLVEKRDRVKLRLLMAKDFHYNCCDESYPDNRTGAFTIWDGFEPKDHSGWKILERVLRTETMIETAFDELPVRMFDDAIFEFQADNRWHFTSFGASDAP